MPHFYLHLRDGTSEVLDHEGGEYASLETVKASVLLSARELMSVHVTAGVLDLRFRLEAEDDKGAIVYSLPFSHAVGVIPPELAALDVA